MVSSGSRASRSSFFAARSYGALHARGRDAVPQAAMGAPDASSHRASSGSSSSQVRVGNWWRASGWYGVGGVVVAMAGMVGGWVDGGMADGVGWWVVGVGAVVVKVVKVESSDWWWRQSNYQSWCCERRPPRHLRRHSPPKTRPSLDPTRPQASAACRCRCRLKRKFGSRWRRGSRGCCVGATSAPESAGRSSEQAPTPSAPAPSTPAQRWRLAARGAPGSTTCVSTETRSGVRCAYHEIRYMFIRINFTARSGF